MGAIARPFGGPQRRRVLAYNMLMRCRVHAHTKRALLLREHSSFSHATHTTHTHTHTLLHYLHAFHAVVVHRVLLFYVSRATQRLQEPAGKLLKVTFRRAFNKRAFSHCFHIGSSSSAYSQYDFIGKLLAHTTSMNSSGS